MPYTTYWEILSFFISLSLKLRYICGLLYYAHYKDVKDSALAEKLLMFSNYPVESWFLQIFL